MNITHLSLGTNLGNKLENLNNAIKKITSLGKITKISSVYQTPPWGFKSDDFYNIALTLETSLNPYDLIAQLLKFESELGRTRNNDTIGYQARPLDIDIIFYNDEIIHTQNLIIPHPRMQDRSFVLIPIIEIIKEYKHPVYLQTLEELLMKCEDDSKIVLTKHSLTTI